MTITKPKTRLDTVKAVTRFIVGRSVSAVVVTLIHQNTEVNTTFQKIQMYIGAYTIGSMVADKARERVDASVDSMADAWKESQKKDDIPDLTVV